MAPRRVQSAGAPEEDDRVDRHAARRLLDPKGGEWAVGSGLAGSDHLDAIRSAGIAVDDPVPARRARWVAENYSARTLRRDSGEVVATLYGWLEATNRCPFQLELADRGLSGAGSGLC
jgi:hypothetical protein